MKERVASPLLNNVLRTEFSLEGELSPIPGGLSNDNFLLKSDSGDYLVKLYAATTSVGRLENELLALQRVGSNFEVPRVVESISGERRVPFAGRVLSCFVPAGGESRYDLNSPPEKLSEIEDLGAFYALLLDELNLSPHWSGSVSNLREALAEIPDVDSSLLDVPSPTLVLHGDFQPGNILYRGEEIVGVCDFEYATKDKRIFEIALVIANLLPSSGEPKFENIKNAFVGGFNSRAGYPLAAAELAAIPELMLLGFQLNISWAKERSAGDDAASLSCREFLDRNIRLLSRNWPI